MKNYRKITSKKKSAGFTLIELIVTVSVAAILMSIAVPSFKTMIDSNRLSTGTNELVSAFVLARSEALKRSQNITVCTSTDSTSCSGAGNNNFGQGWIVFQDCNDNQIIDTSDCDGDTTTPDVAETLINAHSGLKDIEIEMNANASDNLTYSFSGRPDDNVTFVVKKVGETDALKIKNIVIGRSGRIRTQ